MATIKGQKSSYHVIQKLGQGGQGRVLKAEDTSMPGKYVALKVVTYQNKTLEQIYAHNSFQRFHHEFLLTAKLRHPQAAIAFDYGVDLEKQIAFMARPYLSGHTLTEQIIRDGPLPEEEVYRIVLSIAGILEYIHEHGVVHCDIKPSNIFMEHNEPILIDFGLATGDTIADFIGSGGTSGTIDYIAPEIFDRKLRSKYLAAPFRDWWGLGCVAYNILTAKRLFQRAQLSLLKAKLMRGKEQDIIKAKLADHEALPLILALMERDPDKRGSSKDDLEEIISQF